MIHVQHLFIWAIVVIAHHANAAEDSIGTDPGEDMTRQPSDGPHDQEQVHHELDEEDHKDGYVEVRERQTLWDGGPEAVGGEVPEETGDVEKAVANPYHQAPTS